jgi:hypothetical protein
MIISGKSKFGINLISEFLRKEFGERRLSNPKALINYMLTDLYLTGIANVSQRSAEYPGTTLLRVNNEIANRFENC